MQEKGVRTPYIRDNEGGNGRDRCNYFLYRVLLRSFLAGCYFASSQMELRRIRSAPAALGGMTLLSHFCVLEGRGAPQKSINPPLDRRVTLGNWGQSGPTVQTTPEDATSNYSNPPKKSQYYWIFHPPQPLTTAPKMDKNHQKARKVIIQRVPPMISVI